MYGLDACSRVILGRSADSPGSSLHGRLEPLFTQKAGLEQRKWQWEEMRSLEELLKRFLPFLECEKSGASKPVQSFASTHGMRASHAEQPLCRVLY